MNDSHDEWRTLNVAFAPASPSPSCYGPEPSQEERDFIAWFKNALDTQRRRADGKVGT